MDRTISSWTPVDTSAHTLEYGEASDGNTIGLRESANKNNVLYTTPRQLQEFVKLFQSGKIRGSGHGV